LPKLAPALSAQDTRLSEALRLSLLEGLSIRAIAKRLKLSRKTVRRLLARGPERKPPASEPRASLLDAHDAEIRRLLADTPELTAPGILERLRPRGYTGGITILRDRVSKLRPRPPKEAFLTLDFKPGAAFQIDCRADFLAIDDSRCWRWIPRMLWRRLWIDPFSAPSRIHSSGGVAAG
jgi:transposase